MAVPERIGRFDVEGRIGGGAFASVWKARDNALDSDVAIKVLSENWLDSADVRARFLAEARLLRRAESDRVVRVHDLGELDDGRPYLVMTYADLGTLSQRLADGRFSWRVATDVAIEIGKGLAVLHAAGVLHRDIKPSNILYRSRPGGGEQAMLGDLGLGKLLAEASMLTLAGGTPAYMAPEQAQPGAPVSVRTDVYGLASLLYRALTGRTTHSSASLTAVADPSRPAVAAPSTLIPDIPAALDAVVLRSLEPDPERRHPDVKSFIADLRDVLDNRVPAAGLTVAGPTRFTPTPDSTVPVAQSAIPVPPRPSSPTAGPPSPAQGFQSPASGPHSPTAGQHSPAQGFQSPASGPSSPAQGFQSPASGPSSPAQGFQSPASGPSSPAQGFQSPAPGPPSPAHGFQSPAHGAPSPAHGSPSSGSGPSSPAQGFQSSLHPGAPPRSTPPQGFRPSTPPQGTQRPQNQTLLYGGSPPPRPPVHTPPAAPQSRRRRRWLIPAVVVVVLAALAGAAAVWYYLRQPVDVINSSGEIRVSVPRAWALESQDSWQPSVLTGGTDKAPGAGLLVAESANEFARTDSTKPGVFVGLLPKGVTVAPDKFRTAITAQGCTPAKAPTVQPPTLAIAQQCPNLQLTDFLVTTTGGRQAWVRIKKPSSDTTNPTDILNSVSLSPTP